MSHYMKLTKHPIKGHWEMATWLDDYFGRHKYGVKFEDKVFRASKHKFFTLEVEEQTVQETISILNNELDPTKLDKLCNDNHYRQEALEYLFQEARSDNVK